MKTEQQLRALLEGDPGSPEFADYAALLIAEDRLADAIFVCLKGLSKSPDMHRGRLLLAHALFRSGFVPFAAREVEYLCRQIPEHEALVELYHRLNPSAAPAVTSADSSLGIEDEAASEIADIEFEVDLLDDLDKSRR